MSTVLKSGSLNLLETSGSVQACNGIAIYLIYLFIYLHVLLFHFILDKSKKFPVSAFKMSIFKLLYRWLLQIPNLPELYVHGQAL